MLVEFHLPTTLIYDAIIVNGPLSDRQLLWKCDLSQVMPLWSLIEGPVIVDTHGEGGQVTG